MGKKELGRKDKKRKNEKDLFLLIHLIDHRPSKTADTMPSQRGSGSLEEAIRRPENKDRISEQTVPFSLRDLLFRQKQLSSANGTETDSKVGFDLVTFIHLISCHSRQINEVQQLLLLTFLPSCIHFSLSLSPRLQELRSNQTSITMT